MSTEPYPEVTGDESAIVPPQQTVRSAEWPKKIRTLTATELDRLTIDSAGRFYWDSKLVNYNPAGGTPGDSDPKSSEATERSAMDIIDRAVHDLGDHNTPEPIEGAELPRRIHSPLHRERGGAVDLDVDRHSVEVPSQYEAVAFPAGTDRVRVALSRWQSFGAFLVVVGIIVGAAGVAAYGWVAAHDWGCRIGAITSPCPAPVVAPRPPRTDIPA
jgi:hypothetical protein